MHRSVILGTVSILGLAGIAKADVPTVVADIPPVHSLVSMVMGDLGTPDLLVQAGASPHGYSLRPSEARALDNAQIVFWMGEDLEPWMESSLEALAGDAHVIELMAVDGTTELEFREGATFEAHSHDDEDHGHGDHGHDDDAHEDHDHDASHDEHGHDDHDHDDHDHDHDDDHAEADHADHHHGHSHDPHAWLDPQNALIWLDAIAAELAEHDPDNAGTYTANADSAKDSLTSLITDLTTQLEPVRDVKFVVFHDAYQYFETRFDIPAVGSITIADASDPSPARIKEVQDKVAELNVTCAFAEPQFNQNLVRTVFEGTDAKTGIMDPIGADLELGPDLYPQLLRNLSGSLVGCLDQ